MIIPRSAEILEIMEIMMCVHVEANQILEIQ